MSLSYKSLRLDNFNSQNVILKEVVMKKINLY